MKSLVILGASGYIGTHLVHKLHKKYSIKVLVHGDRNPFENLKTVRVFFGNILDREIVKKIIERGDLVIVMAGTTTAVKDEKNHFDVNVIGQSVVASVCSDKGARVIYFSTVHMYANSTAPSKETDRVYPEDIYSFSKKLGEDVYEFYSRTKKLSALVFRLGSVYGPGQHKGIVFTMAESLRKNGTIEIPRMEVVRDLIYVDDVVEAVEKAIHYRKNGFHVFNIAQGKRLTLLKLAETIILLRKNNGVLRQQKRKVSPATIRVSIAKAQKELAFMPKVTLTHGLQKTLFSYNIVTL